MYRTGQCLSAYGFSILFSLLIVLSACSQGADNGRTLTPSPKSARTAIVSTTPSASAPGKVAAQTCPGEGTARGAVMPAMTPGDHSNIVYLSQQNDSSMLERYDTITGLTTQLLQSDGSGQIQQANISPDRQWILFLSPLQDQFAIELVRVDGQQLQTLYCTPVQMNIGAALLSPDQRHLVFNQINQGGSASTLYLLDMVTGQLHTELSQQQPGYPASAQGQQQTTLLSPSLSSSQHKQMSREARKQEFYPMSSKQYMTYTPIKWANNTSIYLFGNIAASGAPLRQLAILHDISKDVTQQQSNLQPVAATTRGNDCRNFDVTPDNQQLVCSTSPTMGFTGASVIQMQPLTGGAARLVHSWAAGGSVVTRALSNSMLIFLLDTANNPTTLWKVNTDGSGLTQLMTGEKTDIFNFAEYSYLPWSTVSPDGKMYAINVYQSAHDTQSLVFGPLDGGTAKTLASNPQGVKLVGWSQL